MSIVGLEGTLDGKRPFGGEWGCIPTWRWRCVPPEVFVRPLLHDEAVRLKRLSKRAKHQCTRRRLPNFSWSLEVTALAAARTASCR
jgi:hypothetical protein